MRSFLYPLIAVVAICLCGGFADALPFAPLNQSTQAINLSATGLLPGASLRLHPVPQPLLLGSVTDDIYSAQLDTALVPVKGTGSPLPIGAPSPEKEKLPLLPGLTHPAPTQDALIASILPLLTKGTPPGPPAVTIDLGQSVATSPSLSRALSILDWLLPLALVATILYLISWVGILSRLAVQTASGLQSAAVAAALASKQTVAGASSTVAS